MTPLSSLSFQAAIATAVRIVVEDHLYWCLVLDRWHREAGKHVGRFFTSCYLVLSHFLALRMRAFLFHTGTDNRI